MDEAHISSKSKIRIEDLISRIFQQETSNLRKLKALRQDLLNQKDFHIQLFYKEIFDPNAVEDSVYITPRKKIENYLRKVGIEPSEDDLTFIFNRLDRDRDGEISFEDFFLAVLGIRYSAREANYDSAARNSYARPTDALEVNVSGK